MASESKQAQVSEFLRGNRADTMTNAEIAAQFECNEGTVRRARKAIEAERNLDVMVSSGVDYAEAAEALRAILAADELEETLALAIEELDEEKKELKTSLKDAALKAKSLRRSARENMPLFDRRSGREATEEAGDRSSIRMSEAV